MKFACTKDNLLHALACVSPVAGKQVNLPILQNILVSMKTSEPKIVSTNLEITITTQVRAKVDIEGDYTIPAKIFLDYISTVPGDRVDAELKEGGLELQLGNSKTTLKGMDANEFPLIPAVASNVQYNLEAKALLKSISQVLFAASKSDARPQFAGVLFNFSPERAKGKLVLAATDSFRLAEKTIALLEGSTEQSSRVIVPARTVSEVARIISVSEQTSPVTVKVSENQISFAISGTEITSRLIDGQYPQYEHIIPTVHPTQLSVMKDELIRQVKAASLFTAKGVGAVQISCKPSEKRIHIIANSSQTGDHTGALDVEGEGIDTQVYLNHRYILDGLSAIENERMVLKVAQSENPVLLVPQMDRDYLYMIMPIKQ